MLQSSFDQVERSGYGMHRHDPETRSFDQCPILLFGPLSAADQQHLQIQKLSHAWPVRSWENLLGNQDSAGRTHCGRTIPKGLDAERVREVVKNVLEDVDIGAIRHTREQVAGYKLEWHFRSGISDPFNDGWELEEGSGDFRGDRLDAAQEQPLASAEVHDRLESGKVKTAGDRLRLQFGERCHRAIELLGALRIAAKEFKEREPEDAFESVLAAKDRIKKGELKLANSAPWVSDDLRRSPAARWLDRHYPTAAIVYRASTIMGMAAAATAGLGLTPLPCHVGDAEPRLQRMTEPTFEPGVSLWLLTHRDLRHTARIRAFLDFMAGALSRERSIFEGKEVE